LNVSKRLELLKRIHPFTGQLAVDLGCGKGSYTSDLAQWYDAIVALDIVPANVSIARERLLPNGLGKVLLCCAAGDALPLADGSADSIFVIEVLDHVPALRLCLEEVFRVLKPGGIFYLTVPNCMFPWEIHPVRFLGGFWEPGWFPFLPWFKFLHDRIATARVFSKRSLRELGESAGFSLVGMDTGYPPLEHRGGPRLRSMMDWLEKTPLRDFGLILAAAFSKPKQDKLHAGAN
jgi:ubiquinone/menaquinone biosynthesis C-methylase UbiE